jgi:hypothetical protein
MWEKTAVAQFVAVSQLLLGTAEENHEIHQYIYPVRGKSFELWTFRLRNRNAAHTTAIFDQCC